MSRVLRRFFARVLNTPRPWRAADLRARLLVQALESRVVPATFTVSSIDDAGGGSLRQAIFDANTTGGADTIVFSALFNSAQTISLTSGQLSVTDAVTITGPGASLLTVRRAPGAATPFRVFSLNAFGVVDIALSGMAISGGNPTGAAASGIAGDGGGILMFNDNVTLNGVVISGNSASREGGGIAVAAFDITGGGAGFLTIRNSTISGNTSNGTVGAGGYGGSGGGLYFANRGSLLLENSTISGNTSPVDSPGGGLYFYGAVGTGGLSIRNCTISGNTAGTSGGGMYLVNLGGTATVQNSTIANNTANGIPNNGDGGGGIGFFGASGTLTLASTVVANNTALLAPDLLGPVTANFCLIRNQTGASITGSNNLAAGTDPLFDGGLAMNGGPTQTIALQATSPLMNVGSNPAGLTTDQRGPGFVRASAPTDIGAYEVQLPTGPTVTSVTVNGGAQRSMVTELTVTFSTTVLFAGATGAAFTLTRTGGGAVGFTPTVIPGSPTVVRLNAFTGADTLNGSLIDGLYTLTVLSAQVTANGLNLDGDGDGTPGGNHVANLHRRFGDTDGDRDVDLSDLIRFGTAYQNPGGYGVAFDFDGDGDVDLSDLIQFGSRYQVPFP